MLAVTRRTLIKELIMEKKSVTIFELTKMFSVNKETIRRDFNELESEGILTKTYGGAFIQEGVQNDIDINIRQAVEVDGKKLIAKQAATLISHGDTIFLDASSTSYFISQQILNMRVTIVTNSFLVSSVIAKSESAQLILAGGIFSHTSKSFVGRSTVAALNSYFVDKAFISCRSVSMTHGITDTNEQQAEIREIAVKQSNQVCLVADFTKFNKTSFTTICPFDKITYIAVDKALPTDWIDFLNQYSITLLNN